MRTLLVVLAALAITGCANLFEPIVYKLPTRQGNVIEQKQLDQLKLGMNRDQVKFLLGTPIAASPFRSDRWDYLGYYKGPRGKAASRTVSLYFENEVLAKMEGQVLASAATDKTSIEPTPDALNKPDDNYKPN